MDTHLLPKPLLDYFGPTDFRSSKWVLSNNYYYPVVLVSAYLLFVYYGPKFMKDKKPFELKYILIVHNFIQIMLSGYMFKEVLICIFTIKELNFRCYKLDQSDNPGAYRLAEAAWFFYFSKYYDMMDTVFLVLRKKNSQLTFLHVYHHAFMAASWYLAVLYLPGGVAFLPILINAFVHLVMYSYYFLAAFGLHKYLWWKKYLTQMQLIQFAILLANTVRLWYIRCHEPVFLAVITFTFLSSLIILFSNFYIQSYLKKAKAKEAAHKKVAANGKAE